MQHKWDTSCRFIFYMRFASILCFTTLLTVVVVNDSWSDHLFYDTARWACIGFSVLLIKSGLHELFTRGLFAFLADSRNWVETYIAVASFVSLIGMELQARRETAPGGDGAALTSEPMSDGGSAASSGKKTVFLSHLYLKMLILSRQARDKHRKTPKKCRFPHLRRPRAEILHEVVNIVGCQGHCQLQRQLPRRIHKREERAGRRPEDQESVSIPEKAVSVFECFPCVYSEPVLVKRISF